MAMGDRARRRNPMPRYMGGVLILPLLLLCVAPSATENAVSGHGDLRSSYRLPIEVPRPVDNPYSPAKASLGQLLYYEPHQSGSRSRSCVSCHNPGLSRGDVLPQAI